MFANNLIRKLLTRTVRTPQTRTIRKPQSQLGGRIEMLEDRLTPAFTSTLSNLTATINGDAAADTFLVTVDTSTAGGPFLVHNRFTAGDAGFESNLDWDSATAGEQRLVADASVTLRFANLGGGDDTLRIVRGADGVTGSGDVNAFIDTDAGGAGNDRLEVDDSTRTTANTFTFDPDNLALTGTGYKIDLGAAAEAGFFITTGTGNDTVNVLGTFSGQELTLDSAGGNETVNIGGAGSLTDILSAVNISNLNGQTTLNIDASADGAATYTVTESQVTSSLASAPINFNDSQISAISLTAGGEADTINAEGVSGGVFDFTADGGAGDDTITGTDGNDLLIGGAGNDFIDGARGADTALMGDGNDTFVWNPGDGSDVVEGGAGTDTLLFNGSDGDEVFDVSANGDRVTFFRNLGNIIMDLDDVEAIDLNALGGADVVIVNDPTGTDLTTLDIDAGDGNDTINAEGVPAGLFFTVNGGAGDDTIIGTNGNDLVIGGKGADIARLGGGNDTFVWNPGDGSDVVEGGAGTDTLLFNGSNGDEIFTVNANGDRVTFFRNLGNIIMDLDDIEAIDLNALGGADTITTGDLTGTDLAALNIDLSGDAAGDAITINGTDAGDNIVIADTANGVTVTGAQPVTVTIKNIEPTDTLLVNGGAGDDTISAEGVAAERFAFTADGGTGNDTLTGTDGNDLLIGGTGNDFVDGARGADTALLGEGNDTFVWNPGDGSDTIEGGAGVDELRFNGSNGDEVINISANGTRARFFRNLGNITMDLNETERVTFNALGGADTITVNDLSGTAVKDVFVNLGGSLADPNTGDGQADTVTVVGMPGNDNIATQVVGNEIQVVGLSAVTHVTGTDLRGDRVLVESGGGNDTIDLSATVFKLPQPGLTSTTVVGADVGGAPVVTTIAPDGTVTGSTTVFDPSFTGGVRVTRADVNGDGVEDTIVGTGPGIATQVKVLDGVTGETLFSFAPFEATFTGGVFVVAGDLNGDGKAEIVITPDEGGGPRVLVFNGADGSVMADFFGIDDPNFRGGARAAIGDLNGDGTLDLLVAAGFGGGPRVAGFDGKSIVTNTPVKLFNDFFVFEQTLRNGVFITSGDLNGDGFADVIVGGGPGGGPRVFAISGKDLVQTGSDNLVQLANFFAGNPDNRGGVRVGVKNLDGDANADLIVSDGTGAGSKVTAYSGATIPTDGTPPELFALDAFSGFNGGVFVG